MKIEYAVPSPENVARVAQGKGEILHVGLRYEKAIDGEDKIHEVLCRKASFDSLTAAKQLAYAQECEKWHHKRDASIRAKWDADDKAKADAAIAAAKAAEEAKFILTPAGYVKDKDGAITGVQVTIIHQGHTCSCVIPPDVATAEANARAAWTESKAKADAEKASLAAFGLVK